LISLNNIVGQAITSKGRMWTGFIFNIFWAISLLATSYYFIEKGYGVTGVAIANFMSYVLHSLWQFVYVLKFFRL